MYKQKCPNHDHFDNHHHPDTLVLEWHYQALPLPSSSAPPRQSGSDGDNDDNDDSDGNSDFDDNDDYDDYDDNSDGNSDL